MLRPDYHIFVCASFRGTKVKGKCHKRDSMNLIPYIQEECTDRGLNAMVTSTGCMNLCDEGPIVIIYPQNYWYQNVEGEEDIDIILDALEDGSSPVEQYLVSEN
ncbi:Ferredoxin [Candidatus Magnetomoraceae bacterium gMMP-15]